MESRSHGTNIDVECAPRTIHGNHVGGHRFGTRIDIQPQAAPSFVVSLTQLRADPSLAVGSNVVSGATRLGAVVNLAPEHADCERAARITGAPVKTVWARALAAAHTAEDAPA